MPGVLLEQEVGMSLARTLLEPPPWLNHPQKARDAKGTWAPAGFPLALLSPWIALALPSAASLGLDGAGRTKSRIKLLRSVMALE